MFEDSRYSTLFISLSSVTSNYEESLRKSTNQLKENLEFFSIISTRTRPRNLFIIVSERKIPENIIKDLLMHAWIKNFLDVTVVQYLLVDKLCEDGLLINMYNPFSNVYFEQCYSNQVDIFPNKLKNMYGYPLKIAMIRRPPALDYDRNVSGQAINFRGADYGATLIVSQIMNFSMKIIASDVDDYAEIQSENSNYTLIEQIIKGEIDCSGNQMYTYLLVSNLTFLIGERSIAPWFDDLVALAPVSSSLSWQIKNNSMKILLGIVINVTSICLLVKIFKFSQRIWLPHYILQILLGNPVTKLPKNFAERLLFFALFILSQYYSVNLYAKLTDIHLFEKDHGPYKTLEDLEHLDVTLAVHKHYARMTFEGHDEILQRLKKKVELEDGIIDCAERVLDEEKVVCLIDKSVALRYLQKYNQRYEPRLKIMKHVFWTSPKGFIFSSASPYVPEYNRILRRVIESGVWFRYIIQDDKFREHDVKKYSFTVDKLVGQKIFVIWYIGCFVSLIAFISELIVYYNSR
ncbi:hypothetical protein QAD02_010027 [Eretmocerus hayati]|uniref:Uncharacterized protein n=1 Tax=Eretmocerus hayati TaxID=131215 RepID=A0ACC2NAX8_9HYME|nr:hypothetical protein QAD02_010027 [Eretmocerus hayati]